MLSVLVYSFGSHAKKLIMVTKAEHHAAKYFGLEETMDLTFFSSYVNLSYV